MNEVDFSRSDRDVGSVLSGEEVERLREAIGWLRGQRGLKLKDIALGCDAAEHAFITEPAAIRKILRHREHKRARPRAPPSPGHTILP